ncbi:MAG: radical SAM protein [Candidatus Saccharicenans sp.]|uniref:radical SAM protein n=1 Tax=Candidatus Saccharicenans sp. TaxID=2819258 RepID=UPI004049670C
MAEYTLDLTFEKFKENLSPDDLLFTLPGLYFSSRDQRILVVEPESASWIVLKKTDFSLLVSAGLIKPGSSERAFVRLSDLNLFQSQQPTSSTDYLLHLLYKLFIRNMVAINGYSYHQPSSLWSVQKYPHYFNLHLTESCNLSCRYCRVDHNGSDPMMMSVETCKKIIKRVLEEVPGKKCIIGFHGGEPLLNIEAVMEGSRYAREIAASVGKELTLSLQTNGVLLPRYSQLLKDLQVEVGVSIDGPEELHNRHRIFRSGRGSFQEVMAGIEAARNSGLNPGFLAVIHNPEDYLAVAGFFFEQLKTRSFRLNYSCYEGRAKRELSFNPHRAAEFARHWLQLVDYGLEEFKRTGTWLSLDDLNLFVAHLIAKDRPHMCYRSPCGAGNAILGFGHDGRIYPCEELVGKDEFCLGHIDDPLSLGRLLAESELLASLSSSRKVDNVPACADCPWRHFHGAGCLNKSYEYFGDTAHRDPMCHFYRTIFEELMWKLQDNPELVNLISYYKKYIKVQNEWLA